MDIMNKPKSSEIKNNHNLMNIHCHCVGLIFMKRSSIKQTVRGLQIIIFLNFASLSDRLA